MRFLTGCDRPPPPVGEVHVWRADLEEEGWAGAEQLPAEERQRAAGFLREAPRRRWVASRWALRGVLGRYLQEEPGEIELLRGDRGKPRLAEEPSRLAFNLSHSGGLALVAVCRDREVGVDVERLEARRDLVALAERALEPEDAASVRAAPASDRARTFHELWARHEARLKCTGVGLGEAAAQPARQIAVETLDAGPGYAAAVAVSGGGLPVRCWTIEPPLPGRG